MLLYTLLVSRRFQVFVSVTAILLMVGSQLCQFFDRWDSLADFGHDTEFMFLTIGICVGLCLLVAWLVVRLLKAALLLLIQIAGSKPPDDKLDSDEVVYLRLLFSPPLSLSSLRI